MTTPPSRLENNAFLGLLLLATLAFLWMLRPFFDDIFWSVVIGLLFMPLRQWLQRRGLGANAASLCTVLVSLAFIILPAGYLLYTCLTELAQLYSRLSGNADEIGVMVDKLRQALPAVIEWLEKFGYGPEKIKAAFSATAVTVSGYLARQTMAIGGGTVNWFIDLAIVLYLAFFLLRDGERIRQLLIRALPFGDHREELLFARFALMLRATVRGSLLVAVAQGALGGLIFAVLGLRAPVLWGVIMTLLSLIPVVGAAVVWLPAAIYLLLTGEIVSGVVLMVYGVCVIGLADNALRPILVGRDTKLPDFMVLLSTLGGFALFGLDGFITGPVLAVLFVTLWQIFMEEFSAGEAATAAAPAAEEESAAEERPVGGDLAAPGAPPAESPSPRI